VQYLAVLKERKTFRIGQAAEALSVTPSWLRFGERLGALPLDVLWGVISPAVRVASGKRQVLGDLGEGDE